MLGLGNSTQGQTVLDGSRIMPADKSPTGLAAAAVAAAEAGDFQAAVTHFKAAICLQPSSAELHEQLAQCLMECEQDDEAKAEAEEATRLDPLWPECWVTCARACLNCGEIQSAQQALLKSLELNPDQPGMRSELLEVEHLLQQQLCRLVGLPGLTIKADPGGQLGPGCVVWDAGIQLARLFSTLSARRAQGATGLQEGAIPAVHTCRTTAQAADSRNTQCRELAAHSGAGPGSSPQQQQELVPAVHAYQLPLQLHGARVLEIGAGTGVVGITAAALGASVLLTDLQELLPLLIENIAGNQSLIAAAGGSATAEVLDWRQQQVAQGQQGHSSAAQQWDWACGADLVFNQGQIEPVVQTITGLLEDVSEGEVPGETRVRLGFLLAHKRRHEEVDQALLQALHTSGLTVQRVHLDNGCTPVGAEAVCVWWLFFSKNP